LECSTKKSIISFLKKIEKDIWVVLLLAIISAYTIFNLKHWNKQDRVIVWDVISYYGYLPATFIYDDVTLQNPNEEFKDSNHTFWYHKTDEGRKIFKTSMGMSILYSPFFFLSHIYVLATDGVASGFSPPYKFGLAMSSLFYFVLGFIFMRKVLRKFYDESVVAITLLLIGLGTNLYYYTVIGVGMPHVYLLALFSLLIFFIIKWYESPTLKLSVLLGLLAGLLVLVRPTMIIVVLFALFSGVNSLVELKKRAIFFKKNVLKILIILIAAFFIWIPQLIYWKLSSDSYLFYSYTEEGFFFSDPQILNSLFSFRKGWLLYTPLMGFSLIGFVIMFKESNRNFYSILFTVGLYFYVASCWWDWWFGGSFGYRTMIEMIPLLAFGLASFILQLFKKLKGYKIPILTLMFLLLCFNLFQTRQAHEGLLHHDSMTKEAYLKVLFKLQSSISREDLEPYLETPNYDGAKKGDRD
jgi:hypothetical protein